MLTIFVKSDIITKFCLEHLFQSVYELHHLFAKKHSLVQYFASEQKTFNIQSLHSQHQYSTIKPHYFKGNVLILSHLGPLFKSTLHRNKVQRMEFPRIISIKLLSDIALETQSNNDN